MIVTRKLFQNVLDLFSRAGVYGLDTETTGLGHGDRLFAIILADEKDGYYFHFEPSTPDLDESADLPRDWIREFQRVFENPASEWDIANARFDLKMIEKEGLRILGKIHDTQVTARLLRNDHFDYSLDACAKRMGLSKDHAVEDFIKEHHLTESYSVPGKKGKKNRKFFWKVPFPILSKYAINDAVLARTIGCRQKTELEETRGDGTPGGKPSLFKVYENEHRLLSVCTQMEDTGIKIDRPFVSAALAWEQSAAYTLRTKFSELTGKPFVDSNKALAEIFRAQGEEISKTPNGNPTFAYEILQEMDTPLARLITDIRTHAMYAGTFYSSFLYYADEAGVIHASMRQDATATGRFSYHEPNLQNVPKEDEKPYPKFSVRGSFIPREDFCFVSIDFEQQEFRMLLDYAGERDLIREILAGKDVHQATAEQMGTTRKRAKTINFGCLYGMGAKSLARKLEVSESQAVALRLAYFQKLPHVRAFSRRVAETGKMRGYIWNWAGRRYYLSDPEHDYVLLNHLIQGGCADVVKFAMVRLAEFLRGYKTRMVCQVHDELLFEVHRSELDIVGALRGIMEGVYEPRNGLPLTCAVDHSWKSWAFADRVKGPPNAQAGNPIQESNRTQAPGDPTLLLDQNANAFNSRNP